MIKKKLTQENGDRNSDIRFKNEISRHVTQPWFFMWMVTFQAAQTDPHMNLEPYTHELQKSVFLLLLLFIILIFSLFIGAKPWHAI